MKREHISMEVRCFKCSICPDSSDEQSAFDGIKKKIFFFFFYKPFEFAGKRIHAVRNTETAI